MSESRAVCCPSPDLEGDARFETHPGPVAERVVVCRGCGALWIEEWTVLWIGDSDRDDFRYLRITDEEAAKRFDRAL